MNVMVAGIEASGKTVLLSCLYGLYKRPDKEGYFLNPKDPETYTYLESNLSILHNENWPEATAVNGEKLLWLELRTTSQKVLCDIPVRDFAGEVYVGAFGGEKAADPDLVANLKRQIKNADILLAIVNLQDLVNGGELSEEDLLRNWTTKALFDYVATGENVKRKKMAIVLTKSDFYGELIRECGGPRAVVEKYLPSVAYVYENIDVFAVSAVDKVVVLPDGVIVPDRDFSSESLRPVMKWIIQRAEEVKREEELERERQELEAREADLRASELLKKEIEDREKAARAQEQAEAKALRRGRAWRCPRGTYWLSLFLTFFLFVLSSVFLEIINIFSIIAFLIWAWTTSCRLHDFNRSGWWVFLGALLFYPPCADVVFVFGAITSIILGFIPGTKGINRWGKLEPKK